MADLSGQVVGSIIGNIFGGIIAVAICALIAEKLVLQRNVDDPLAGKVGSLIVGWLMVGGLAAYGETVTGGAYRWAAFFSPYGISAIILLPFAIRSGYKLRAPQHDDRTDCPNNSSDAT